MLKSKINKLILGALIGVMMWQGARLMPTFCHSLGNTAIQKVANSDKELQMSNPHYKKVKEAFGF